MTFYQAIGGEGEMEMGKGFLMALLETQYRNRGGRLLRGRTRTWNTRRWPCQDNPSTVGLAVEVKAPSRDLLRSESICGYSTRFRLPQPLYDTGGNEPKQLLAFRVHDLAQ